MLNTLKINKMSKTEMILLKKKKREKKKKSKKYYNNNKLGSTALWQLAFPKQP